MLILKLKDGEDIEVGPDVTLKIMHNLGGRSGWWIGFEAPKEVLIMRKGVAPRSVQERKKEPKP